MKVFLEKLLGVSHVVRDITSQKGLPITLQTRPQDLDFVQVNTIGMNVSVKKKSCKSTYILHLNGVEYKKGQIKVYVRVNWKKKKSEDIWMSVKENPGKFTAKLFLSTRLSPLNTSLFSIWTNTTKWGQMSYLDVLTKHLFLSTFMKTLENNSSR